MTGIAHRYIFSKDEALLGTNKILRKKQTNKKKQTKYTCHCVGVASSAILPVTMAAVGNAEKDSSGLNHCNTIHYQFHTRHTHSVAMIEFRWPL